MKKYSIRKGSLLDRILRKDLRRNKVISITLMLIGFIAMKLVEGGGAIFLLSLILGLPVFFSKENVIT